MGNWRITTAVVLSLGAVLCHAQANSPIDISYEPVWSGKELDLTVNPIRISIENRGKDDIAKITLVGQSGNYTTTVELPAASTKEVELYFQASVYGEPTKLQVSARQGGVDYPLPGGYGLTANSGVEIFTVAVVGDNFGDLSFLRKKGSKPAKNAKQWETASFQDVYAKPGKAPRRAVGYLYFDAVILGDGAERMTDDEVRALQQAVLAGGHVVIMGGASKPLLADPRWKPFLPVLPGQVVNRPLGQWFEGYAGNLAGDVGYTQADAVLGAMVGQSGPGTVRVTMPVGNGAVTFLPFDLFAGSMRLWEGRRQLLYGVMRGATQRPIQDTEPGGSLSHWPNLQQSNASMQASTETFGISLPPTSTIGLVLLAYMVLVVPVNFWVLKRLRKGELAWVTSPLLAIGCAGVFFTFAGNLYQIGLTRITTGTLWVADGVPYGVFMGSQVLYFPAAGDHDLRFTGVEFVAKESDQYYYGRMGGGMANGQETWLDMGEIVAPRFHSDNLSFKSYNFVQNQATEWSSPGQLKAVRTAKGYRVTGTLRNTTGQQLDDVAIRVGRATWQGKSVMPGDVLKVDFVANAKQVPVNQPPAPPVLAAEISAAPFGAQVGNLPEKSTRVNLMFQLKWGAVQ